MRYKTCWLFVIASVAHPDGCSLTTKNKWPSSLKKSAMISWLPIAAKSGHWQENISL